jgi:hypothetical protein
MGCIGYPINTSFLKGKAFALLENVQLDVDFPIGSLEIAASREELQYSEKTKKALLKRLDVVCSELAKEVSKLFEECNSLWEARGLYNSLFGSWRSPLNHLRTTIGKEIRWKGKLVSTQAGGVSIQDYATAIKFSLQHQITRTIVKRENDVKRIVFSRDTALLINDTDKKPGEKIGSWLKFGHTKSKQVYLITLNEWNKEHESALHQILGTNPRSFRTISSLPKPIRKKPVKTGGKTAKSKVPIYARGVVFREDKSYFSYRHDQKEAWEREDLDLTIKDGVYVSWQRGVAKMPHGTPYWSPRKIKNILLALEDMGKKPDKLYGVKTGYLLKFEENVKGWKTLEDYATECLEEFIKVNKLEDQIKATYGAEDIKNLDLLENVAKYIKKPSKLKRFINIVHGSKNIQRNTRQAIALALEMNYTLEKGSPQDLANEIWDRYPMLKWMEKGYYYRNNSQQRYKDAAEYVELIDKEREKI